MGVPLEAVAIRHERAIAPREVRLSGRVRRAVDAMVMDGLSRREAAVMAGLTDNALYAALTKPHVLAYRNDRLRVLRESEASRTIARAVNLADGAASEHVRLQANTWIAGIEGISPITKSESVNVHKHLLPGLTIVMGGGHNAHVIDGLAQDVGSPKQINMIGKSVPHPSMRNAAGEAVEVALQAGPPVATGVGKKRGRADCLG